MDRPKKLTKTEHAKAEPSFGFSQESMRRWRSGLVELSSQTLYSVLTFGCGNKHTIQATLSSGDIVVIWIDDTLPQDQSWPMGGPPYVEIDGGNKSIEGVTHVGTWNPSTTLLDIIRDCEVQLRSTDDASARMEKASAGTEEGHRSGFVVIC